MPKYNQIFYFNNDFYTYKYNFKSPYAFFIKLWYVRQKWEHHFNRINYYFGDIKALPYTLRQNISLEFIINMYKPKILASP